MYKRALAQTLLRFATIYPVLGLTGPRQSGKTTLAKMLFAHLPYVSFENIDIRLRAQGDPRAFLAQYASGGIFDEIQHVPELLSYMQEIVDNSSDKGKYVLTGSQNFAISAKITQSLSGRIGMATLLPLSQSELISSDNIYDKIFRGGYPGLHKQNINPLDFYPSYIQTYIERDVRQLQNIENLGRFQTFIKLCAGRVGQIINFSSLAIDAGISHTTARKWLSILEASYLVFFLQPFHQNFNKQLIKMPKLYFYDTGLACSLLGLESSKQLENHYLKGALYENLVILELLKARTNQALPGNLYFWRDRSGHEVDVIAQWGGKSKAIEIKFSASFASEHTNGLDYFAGLTKDSKNYLVNNGVVEGEYRGNILVPFDKISTLITS